MKEPNPSLGSGSAVEVWQGDPWEREFTPDATADIERLFEGVDRSRQYASSGDFAGSSTASRGFERQVEAEGAVTLVLEEDGTFRRVRGANQPEMVELYRYCHGQPSIFSEQINLGGDEKRYYLLPGGRVLAAKTDKELGSITVLHSSLEEVSNEIRQEITGVEYRMGGLERRGKSEEAVRLKSKLSGLRALLEKIERRAGAANS